MSRSRCRALAKHNSRMPLSIDRAGRQEWGLQDVHADPVLSGGFGEAIEFIDCGVEPFPGNLGRGDDVPDSPAAQGFETRLGVARVAGRPARLRRASQGAAGASGRTRTARCAFRPSARHLAPRASAHHGRSHLHESPLRRGSVDGIRTGCGRSGRETSRHDEVASVHGELPCCASTLIAAPRQRVPYGGETHRSC